MSIAQIYDQMKTDIAQGIGTTSHNDTMEVTESGNWITSEGTIYKVIIIYYYISLWFHRNLM